MAKYLPSLSPIGTNQVEDRRALGLIRIGSEVVVDGYSLTRSCLTISKISFKLKSSVGFRRLLERLQGNGYPSLPNGLNCRRESLMQSKSTLLWICSHSTSKFYGTLVFSSSTGMPCSAASFSRVSLTSSSLLAFLFFSSVK